MNAQTSSFDFRKTQDALISLRGRRIFFIGGMPKSGSTWLQLLLNAHPEISCQGEGHFLDSLGPLLAEAINRQNALVDQKSRTLFSDLSSHPLFIRDDLLYLLASAISLMLLRPEKAACAAVLGEKTPDNMTHVPVLREMFPHARFVHLVRDGRDCAVSAWFHRLRLNPVELAAQYGSFAEYLSHAAYAWNQEVRRNAALVDANPEHCVTIRYEDLSQAPEATLGPLLAFLGASSDPSFSRICFEAADFQLLSGGRQRGEEDRTSFFRRGTVGNWRQHFDQAAETVFYAQAQECLLRFGYV